MQRAKHRRTFGTVYNASPCGNILGSIMVCIRNIAAIFASKVFSFSLSNMHTRIAGLRSVCRWNGNHFNSGKQTFIGQILAELVKTPSVQFCLLPLAFGFCRLTNVGQIFNGYSLVFGFCLLNYLFCNRMVVDGNESPFSPAEPFQKSFRTFCAFGLNRRSYFGIFFSDFFKLTRIEISAVGQDRNVGLTKINADKIFNVLHVFFRNFDSLKKIKLFLLEKKVGLAFYVRNVIFVVADKWNVLQSSIYGPNGNRIALIGEDSRIICDRAERTKISLNFFVSLIRIGYFGNAPNYHLSRKIKRILDGIVDFFMELVLVVKFFLEGNLRNIIACRICLLDRIKQRSGLILIRQQLYFKRQLHDANILQLFETSKSNINNLNPWQFLLDLEGVEVSLPTSR